MKVTKETLKNSQIKLKIELEPHELEEYKQKAVKLLSEQVKIPGFRPGTANYDVVKLHLGEPAILRQMIDLALPQTYSKAVTDEKIPVVSRPEVNILSENPLVYEATVAILPEVKVKNYKDIKVEIKTEEVGEKDVDNVLDNLKKHYATYAPIDRPAKKGDRVEIDFNGKDSSGVSLEGTQSKNHPVVIGENSLLPDFEKNLEGMKVGETKTFTMTFPKDYHAEHFRNKDVTFETTINRAEEPQHPEINDEFVERVTGEKKSVPDLKKEIHANLKTQRANEERMKQEDKLLEELLERTEVDIPQQLIDEEIEYILEDLNADLKEKGVTMEQYMKATKKTQEDMVKEYQKEAEKRIKIRLALQFLFTEEKIEAGEQDIDAEIAELVTQYPENQREKAVQEYKKNSQMLARIRNRAMLKKLFDKLLHTSEEMV